MVGNAWSCSSINARISSAIYQNKNKRDVIFFKLEDKVIEETRPVKLLKEWESGSNGSDIDWLWMYKHLSICVRRSYVLVDQDNGNILALAELLKGILDSREWCLCFNNQIKRSEFLFCVNWCS